MNQGAEVISVPALQDLVAALESFAWRRRELLAELEHSIARQLEWLEDRYEAWQRELEQRQRRYDEADEDDDPGYLAWQVAEAEEGLQRIAQHLARVREAAAYYRRCAARIAAGPDDQARHFLQSRIAELEKYLAIRLDAAPSAVPPLPGTEVLTNVISAAEQTVAAGLAGIMDAPLPEGFTWVPLTAISATALAELPADDDYKKVAKAEMQRGFAVLQRDVLPAIKRDVANRDYFFQLDQQTGQAYEHGVQRIYEAFFGDEPITLDRNRDSATFNVTLGRHRLKVARELGWPAVPAKLI